MKVTKFKQFGMYRKPCWVNCVIFESFGRFFKVRKPVSSVPTEYEFCQYNFSYQDLIYDRWEKVISCDKI